MDTAPLDPESISALAKLLASGGSAATVLMVWVAYTIRDRVNKFIDSTISTHEKLIEQNQQIVDELKRISK